jgi:hypothetical protein
MGVEGGAPNIDGASPRGLTASVMQITFHGRRYPNENDSEPVFWDTHL